MKNTITLWLAAAVLLFAGSIQAQRIADPDSIAVGNRQQPTIFLVGTIHFAYYNLDAHKTATDKQVNVQSEGRQRELQELLDCIARFKPTKIAVEAGSNTGYLMKRYNAYKAGTRELDKDEIEQIGFRLMQRFDLDTICGTNDMPLVYSLADSKDSVLLRPILDSIYKDWDFQSNDSVTQLYRKYYRYLDDMKLKTPLLEISNYYNADKVLRRGYGVNLVGDFTLGNTRGADALAMHWYSRNLRIYRHIQQIITSPDDRILVLYGQGHIQILQQLFESSPEFRLVKFNEL